MLYDKNFSLDNVVASGPKLLREVDTIFGDAAKGAGAPHLRQCNAFVDQHDLISDHSHGLSLDGRLGD